MRFLAILLAILMLGLFVGCKGDKSDKTKGDGQSQSDELPVEDRDDEGWSQDVI